jgi:phosphatidylglycerol---prolipoprotein diacylglyceryl transferase
MIPYFEIPSLPIAGSIAIHPFGVLVACAILIGFKIQMIRARQLKLDEVAISALGTWVVGFGFVVAHVFAVVAYQPQRLLEDPLYLFKNFAISSFGGFLGAVIGLLLWQRRYQKPLLPYADATVFGFVFAWFFGRLGCFSAHDHPGRHTDFFLAVRYPDGPRHDLGFEEALLTIPLCIAFALAFRKPRRPGVYIAAACLYYPPVRFLLDTLRATDVSHPDARYFGLTPGQYASVAMFLFGLTMLWRLVKRPPPLPA